MCVGYIPIILLTIYYGWWARFGSSNKMPCGSSERTGATWRCSCPEEKSPLAICVFSSFRFSVLVASLTPAYFLVLAEIISSTLKMEVICSSETSVATQQTTRRHIPEDDTTLHNHRCENLKSYTHFLCLCLSSTVATLARVSTALTLNSSSFFLQCICVFRNQRLLPFGLCNRDVLRFLWRGNWMLYFSIMLHYH
jgi:hypothetical protein